MDENWVPWDTMPGKQRVVLSDSTCRDRSQPHWRRQSEQPYHDHHLQDPLKAKNKNKMFREYKWFDPNWRSVHSPIKKGNVNDKFELVIFRLSVANKRCFGVCLCIYLIDNYAWYLIHLRFLSNKLNYGNIKINPCAQKRAGSAAFRSFITTCYDRRVADLQLTLDKEVAPSSDLHFH